MRDSPTLRKAEEVILSTFKSVEKLIACDPAVAACTLDRLLPDVVRAQYFNMYSHLPRKIQHLAAANLWIMEGCCLLKIKHQPEAALEAFKNGIAIKEAMYAKCSSIAVDILRIVGLSMAIGNKNKARALLARIWQDFFCLLNIENPQVIFHDFSVRWALPWWEGSATNEKMAVLGQLALEVAKSTKRSMRSNSKVKQHKKL